METIAIVGATVLMAGLLSWPKLARAELWKATITPLASIIGSGFLVLGPILAQAYGAWTPLAMALLCALAYAIGAAVRFNIASLAHAEHGPRTAGMERIASWALAFAYVISVAYYLNLLGAFAVSLTPWDTQFAGRIVTSAVFGVILLVGWTRGFKALERMEQVSVGLKLAIIAGLLVGLGWFFAGKAQDGSLIVTSPSLTGWAGISLLFGLIVTVQGFETSRYLGEEYDATTRVRSMRLAQWVSTGIYMIYVVLMAYVFRPDQIETSETAIIDMMRIVAPILPAMLVIAALAAQFSAAVADTSGSGGLVEELTKGRVPVKAGYAVLVALGLVLTWALDVFQIISWASKAFAAYYTVQGAIAVELARREGKALWQRAFFAAVTVLAAVVTLFGTAVE
ncbi:MAG: APC family permease [Rhodobacteraceae bacterium]|nr:MAG: APC family permease [Paracoccaceae bacterium]